MVGPGRELQPDRRDRPADWLGLERVWPVGPRASQGVNPGRDRIFRLDHTEPLQAPEQEIAWEYVDRYAKIILPVIVGVTTIKTVSQLKKLAWVILLSHAYPAFELNMKLLGGYNQLKEEGFGFMDNNSYAISLVSASGLAFFLFLHAERWWQKAIAAGSAAVIIHAVIFSNSRGGMLGADRHGRGGLRGHAQGAQRDSDRCLGRGDGPQSRRPAVQSGS